VSSRSSRLARGALVLSCLTVLVTGDSSASRPLPDYRYFRALSIDLLGRPPTRDELAAIERPDFSFDAWIDAHLTGPSYAERIARVYTDLLRLEIPPTVHFEPPAILLNRAEILGPDGKPMHVYFRGGQRRTNPIIDGSFCFSTLETGRNPKAHEKPSIPVSQQLLDERTVEVKPWWLYSDYRSANPVDLAGPHWMKQFPQFGLYLRMFLGPDNKPPATVRVCKEEAQTSDVGHVYATGRIVTKKDKILPGRTGRLPADSPYAKAHKGELISCSSQTAFASSTECGCGVGLERCVPLDPNIFTIPHEGPLGADEPFATGYGTALVWMRGWWTEEPRQFLQKIFQDDRDVRELVTGRGTMINGPLAQFYRFMSGSTCCGNGSEFGYATPDSLFDPSKVPTALRPEDADTWTWVPDRGPHAAGLMTMPVFLLKYGSRRSRAHVLYNAFLCRDFVASTVKLTPSTEPNLMKRPGCSACHETLEPLAAYFSRVQESDWTYLPASTFPISMDRCRSAKPGQMPGACRTYYDPAFSDEHHTSLRGSYAAPDHADEGPPGLGASLAASPDFAPCVVKNVAQSLLGRPLAASDEDWKRSLAQSFAAGGYHMRSLVRAILTSPQYRSANDIAGEAK
jgi:hypothetical protein